MTRGEATYYEQILKPLYSVQLVKNGRSRFYRAEALDRSWCYDMPGTTSITDIIGGHKTRALMSWAVRIGCEELQAELVKYGPESVIIEPDLIERLVTIVKKAHTKKKDAAMDRGTLYHDYLERWANGESFDAPDEFNEALAKLKIRLSMEGVDVLRAEVPVASIEHKMGGKIDAVARRMGDIGLLDWKFASFTSPDYCLQVGGSYAQCFKETFGIEARWAMIFRYDFAMKDWETKTIKNTEVALKGFLAAKQLKEIIESELYCDA